MNPQEYKDQYAHTLSTDPTSKVSYIKFPITDYQELSYLQQSLLESLVLLTQHEENTSKETRHCMFWIAKLLLASYPNTELEGIDELLNELKHQ